MDGEIIRGKADEECIPGGLFCPHLKPRVYLCIPNCDTAGREVASGGSNGRYPAPLGVLAPNLESSLAVLDWVRPTLRQGYE